MLGKASLAVTSLAFALAAAALPPSAQAEGGVKIGILTCNVASGWGFVFGSTRDLRCHYAPDQGAPEHYTGTINKFGADIGYTSAGVVSWAVFAPGGNVGKGALAGDYGGATGSAAVGVGAGVNVLVGGSSKNITLQPLSIEGLTGVNVAAGIASVTLASAP